MGLIRPIPPPFRWLVKAAVSTAALALILRSLDPAALRTALSGANWFWFAACIALNLSITFLQALRWKVLIPIPGVTFRKYLYYVFVGQFLNLFSPSAALAEGVRIYAFGKRYGSLRKNFVAALFARAIGLVFLLALALLAYVFSGDALSDLPMRDRLGVSLGGAWWWTLAGLAALALIAGGVFRKKARAASGDLKGFLLNGRGLVHVMLLSLLLQIVMISSVYALFRTVNWSLSLWHAAFIPAVIQIILLLPISFGGVGVREYVSLVLYGELAGVPVSVVIAISVLAYVPFLLTAGLGWGWFLRRKKEAFQSSATPPP